MKLITAIIKPFKLDEVRDALSAIGVSSITASETTGFGRQSGRHDAYGRSERDGFSMPKVKLEIVVSDDLAARSIDVIRRAAQTGHAGDGKIFVAIIERTIRIRTGECDDAAL